MSIQVTIVTARRLDPVLAVSTADFIKAYQLSSDLERRNENSVFSDREFVTAQERYHITLTNDFKTAVGISTNMALFYATLDIPEAAIVSDSEQRSQLLDEILTPNNHGKRYEHLWPTLEKLIGQRTPLVEIFSPGAVEPLLTGAAKTYRELSIRSFEEAKAEFAKRYQQEPAIASRVRFLDGPKLRLETAVKQAHDYLLTLPS